MTAAPEAPVRFVADLMKPTARQREAIEAVKAHRYTLYGGARGGGKSRWLRWTLLGLLLRWATQGHRRVRAAIFCEDYPTLYDRQLSKIVAEIPRSLGTFHVQNREWHLPEDKGVLCFRNLDDPSKYQSAEFAAIGVDELTKNPLDVFNTLRASMRWPGIEDTRFLGATNPGGIGHLWVRQYWVEKLLPPELEPFRSDFHFVQSLPTDNPHLTQSYWDQLRSLPENLRKAWVEGSWDVFEGQAFTEWDRTVHVIPEFKPPSNWRLACGMDWGIRNKAVVLLCASDPEQNVVVLKEWVWREKDAYEAGFDFASTLLVSDTPWPEYLAADSSTDEPAGIGGTTILQEFQAGVDDALKTSRAPKLVCIPAPRGKGSRNAGFNLVRRMLAWGPRLKDGTLPQKNLPRLRIVQGACPDLVTTLPALTYDPNDKDDVDTTGDDHAYDALRYYLQLSIPKAEKPTTYIPENVHPGFIPGTRQRRSRTRSPETEMEELVIQHEAMGDFNGGGLGYGRRPR